MLRLNFPISDQKCPLSGFLIDFKYYIRLIYKIMQLIQI